MKVLSLDSVHEWLRTACLLDAQQELLLTQFQKPIRLILPQDAGRKTNLGRVLAASVVSKSEGLLWIDEFGIWPSSENWVIFDGLRSLVGEKRPLYEAPGHLFTAEDEQLLSAMLATILYFSWGAVVVRNSLDLVIRISHDECVDFYGSADTLGAVQSVLRRQRLLPEGR